MASSKYTSAHVRLPADERREQLIQVAIDLFSRHGFNGTTTREIAAAAGVTEALIFRHFETKEHLYAAIIDRRLSSPGMTEWVEELRSAMTRRDDQCVIKLLISGIILKHKTDPKFERLMVYAALEGNQIALQYMRKVTAGFVDTFRSYFSDRQADGYMCPMSPDAALMAIVGMAHNFALCKYVHNFKEYGIPDDQALDNFTQIAIHGLFQKPKSGALKKTVHK